MVFAIHWHESAMDLHVFPIPIPPPTALSTQSLWVFPVHQARALVSCIPPGLVICFTIDNMHVSMLFSQNIPPLPSPAESKSLFCTSVTQALSSLYCECYFDATFRPAKPKIFSLWTFIEKGCHTLTINASQNTPTDRQEGRHINHK